MKIWTVVLTDAQHERLESAMEAWFHSPIDSAEEADAAHIVCATLLQRERSGYISTMEVPCSKSS